MDPLLVILLIDMVAVVYGAILGVRSMDQKLKDRHRKTYRLNFPGDLSPDQVETFLKSISGTLRGGKLGLTGTPSVVFEVFASSKGIVHLLKIPYGAEKYVIPQLGLASITATPEEEFDSKYWTHAVELGLSNAGRPLRIDDTAAVSASILKCFEVFDAPDEALVYQWVVTPAAPRRLPEKDKDISTEAKAGVLMNIGAASADEIAERRKKLEQRNFTAVVRVGGYAQTEAGARHLVERVRMALSSVRSPTTRFQKRLVSMGGLRERIFKAATPIVLPAQVTASELSALMAWPMGRPIIAGLAPVMTRHMPASISIPEDGRRIGRSSLPGSERWIAMDYQHATKHTWVLGPSGRGKTTLLTNMAVQDMDKGYGVLLIENKRDLFLETLKRVPSHRLDDVIVIDIDDDQMPVGFNILDQGHRGAGIEEISELIGSMYANVSASIQAPRVIHHALRILSKVPGHTFVDLPMLLDTFPAGSPERQWQEWVLRQLPPGDDKNFLQGFMRMSDRERSALALPVLNRTWEFTKREGLKRILGQRTSSFQMAEALESNKIILVNLNKAAVGKQTSSLLGMVLIHFAWKSVQSLHMKTPTFVYMDEAQEFLRHSAVEEMYEKGRSYGFGLVAAHQTLGQVTDSGVRTAMIGNSANKIVFRPSADDVQYLARHFAGQVKPEEFLHIPEHGVIASLITDKGQAPAVTAKTVDYTPDNELAPTVVAMSRGKYGREISTVNKEMTPVAGADQQSRKVRPKISGDD